MADVVELVVGEEQLAGAAGHGHRLQVGDDGGGDDGHQRNNQRQADAHRRVIHQPAAILIHCVGVSTYRVLSRLERFHGDAHQS